MQSIAGNLMQIDSRNNKKKEQTSAEWFLFSLDSFHISVYVQKSTRHFFPFHLHKPCAI